MSEMRELTEDEIWDLRESLSSEGFDYTMIHSGWEQHLSGTKIGVVWNEALDWIGDLRSAMERAGLLEGLEDA